MIMAKPIRSGGLALALSLAVLCNGETNTNWDIIYQGMTANLSGGDGRIDFQFIVGRERQFESQILAHDCEDALSGIDLVGTPSPVVANDTHANLALQFSFDKSVLIDSGFFWDSAKSALKFCHRLTLVLPNPSASEEMWVITEDRREITINLDTTTGFTVVQELSDGSIRGGRSEAGGCFDITRPTIAPKDQARAEGVIQRAVNKHVEDALQGGQVIFNTTVTAKDSDNDPETPDSYCFETIVLESLDGECKNGAVADKASPLLQHLVALFPPTPPPKGDTFRDTLREDEMFAGEDVVLGTFVSNGSRSQELGFQSLRVEEKKRPAISLQFS